MKAFIVSDVKSFMNGLLAGDLFTSWELRSLELSVLTYIEIDGAVNENYLTDEEKESRPSPFILWEEIQGKVRQLISGGRTPSSFSMTLAFPQAREILSLPEGWMPQLNLRYMSRMEDGKTTQSLTLFSAMSCATFSLDKTPERLWEDFIPTYFRGKNILLMEDKS